MKRTAYLLPLLVITLFVAGCSKSGDPTPAAVTAADLLTRKWVFNEVAVKTDAKQYVIPVPQTSANSNVVTFATGGTYTYYDDTDAKTKTGKWALSNNDKTLTTTDADGEKSILQINSLSATNVEFASITVDMSKTNQTAEEQSISFQAGLYLLSLDKQYGGTIDFDKEPKMKTVQIITKGKAQ